MSDLLKVALNCVEKGWYVFPLQEREKKPDLSLVPHWSEDSSNDAAKINEWWTKSPNANIGIDLEKSDLTVLDFDGGDCPPNLNLPETFVVRTGRGQHWYYAGKQPQGDMYFAEKSIGQVKSGGGYVVGPRSLHPSGATYSIVSRSPIVPVPVEIVEKLKKASSTPKVLYQTGTPILEGQRDTILTSIAGAWRQSGLEYEEILSGLSRVNEECCKPPKDDADIVRITTSVCKYPVGRIGPTVLISGKPAGSATVLSTVSEQPTQDVENWINYFRTVGQLEDGDVRMLIGNSESGFLPEGINFIGALSGHGKTLLGLSMVKSLTTGAPFLGRWSLDEVIPCLYLIPESSSRAFKMRCKAFHIPDDPELFLCRTITEGATLRLDSPVLLKAIEKMKPVVFLDTMIRFSYGKDENSATENQLLAQDILGIRAAGAIAVVGLHHSTKASASEELTLENCLRGTGDMAALCDSVYGIRRDRILHDDGNGANEIDVKCVKSRDIKNPPKPFRIAATYQKEDKTIVSYIDESGDFHMVESAAVQMELEGKFLKLVVDDPSISRADIAALLGMTEHNVRKLANKAGWIRPATRNGLWATKPIKQTALPTEATDADDEQPSEE